MFKEFVDNCVDNIDSYWEGMLQYVDNVAGILGGLCGLAAFLYIGSKVWSSYARGESIEVYPLLRPFVIGLLCTQFNTVVIGGVRGLADPICEYFAGLEAQTSQVDVTAEYTKALDKAQKDAAKLQETLDKQMEASGESEGGRMRRFFRQMLQNIKNSIFRMFAWLFGFIADLMASLTKFVLLFTRCFSLSVLSVLGPLVFVASIFPGFKQGIVQWIARFVCIYMWIPLFHICDIFINTVKSAIGSQLVGNITSMIAAVNPANPDPSQLQDIAIKLQGVSSNIAILGALISILAASLYKSVPTLASWLIAGGDASGNLASIGAFANTTAAIAGAGAGAITSKVGGLGAKLGGAAMRGFGGAAGRGMAKSGQKIASGGSSGGMGTGASAPISTMGSGPRTSPQAPVGFRASTQSSQAADETTSSVRFSEASTPAGRPTGERDLTASVTPLPKVGFLRRLAGHTLIKAGKLLQQPELNYAMRYGNARQRYIAAQNEFATRSVLKKALDDDNPFIQQAAINNKNISPRLLRRAVKYGYEETANAAASRLRELGKKVPDVNSNPMPSAFSMVHNLPIRPDFSPQRPSPVPAETPAGRPTGERDLTASVTPLPKVGFLRRLAGNTLIKAGKLLQQPELNYAMRYGNARQRYIAAQNELATRSVLKKALDDDNPFIQQAAINNKNISPRLLRRAVKYGYEETANAAASRLRELGKKVPDVNSNPMPSVIALPTLINDLFEAKKGAKKTK